MKTILLTGASGFIGFNVARKLLSKDNKLIAPVRKESLEKLRELSEYPNLKVIEGLFFDKKLLHGIPDKIDVILHFASIRGAGVSSKENYYKVNVFGTRMLLEYAREAKIPEFIFCSSVGVLGSIPKKLPASVKDPADPDGEYHKSKYEAEKLVMQAHGNLLKTCSLRPPVTYGYKDDGFIPRMISMIGNSTLFLPRKDIIIHMLSATSFANLVAGLTENKNWYGKIYHVADKEPVYLRDLVNKLSRIFYNKSYSEKIRVPNVIYHITTFLLSLLSISKLKTSVELISKTRFYDISETVNDLGYNPVDTLEEINNLRISS